MNDFTRELLELAYTTCKKRRGTELTVANVKHQMGRHWVNYRDGIIATWAAQTYARVPHARLSKLVDNVWDELGKISVDDWEPPEEAHEPEFAAWGLACLRWVYQEHAGRVPVPDCTDEEIGAFIAEKEVVQLPLFS